MPLCSVPAFGYETSTVYAERCESSVITPTLYNVTKVIGYIPLIGTIQGICRLVLISIIAKTDDESVSFTARHLTRGVIETLSLGVLLVGFDIILTIYRTRKSDTSSQ